MESFFEGVSGGNKGKFTLAATVDEHSLVFALVRSEDEKPAVIRHGTRFSSSYPGTFLLEDLIAQAHEKFSIQELVVSFAAPYFEIQSAVQSVRRISGTHEITGAEKREIESKMSEQAERQLRTRLFEDSGILPGAFVLQKIKVLSWKIDGYAVPQPVGFKGQQVEGCALGTFLREDYANLVEKLKKKYRLKNAEIIHPFETIQRRGHIGVFLYITEEKTQGLIINKESFGLTNSFSPGGNRFRDAFQDEFGMVENIAEEFERKYIRGELSEETREKVHSFLLPEVYNFGTLVREKLESIKIFAPSHVFIFGDGVRFREILQMFISFDTDNNPFREKPILAVLLPKDLDDNMSFPKGIGIEYTAMRFLLEEHYAKKTH